MGISEVERERHGRRNIYRILGKLPLRHSVESHGTVEGLIRFVLDSRPGVPRWCGLAPDTSDKLPIASLV